MMHIHYGGLELSMLGAARFDWRDPYYLAVALSWPWFVVALLALYVALNLIFAGLYLLQPGAIANARSGSFADAFFFSIETLATVGYGAMSPATLYGHVIASIEVISGMAFTAIATGLMFVRFSRPRAKIVYAQTAVVAKYRGRRTLMIRIANGRITPLLAASARLAALVREATPEGQFFRLIRDLTLLQPAIPVFGLTWTIMHDLEGDSPLRDLEPRNLAASDTRLFLTLDAHDPVMAASVQDTHIYQASEIQFGMRYADAVWLDEHGHPVVDLTRISRIEPDIEADVVSQPESAAGPPLRE
jgi:inward rectifier potassium channel